MTRAQNAELSEGLASACRQHGWQDRAAVVVDGTRVTHGDVHEGAARAATVLAERGVGRGDLVAIGLPDGPELAWTFLGAVRLGAVAVPINPALTAQDYRAASRVCRPHASIGDESITRHFGAQLSLSGGELRRLIGHSAPSPSTDRRTVDPAYAQFTSGTGGAPRAAVHRHGDPWQYQRAFGAPVLGLREGEVVLSVSKMFFAYGLANSLFYPLLSGATAVLFPGRPTVADVANAIRAEHVGVLFAVPSFFARMLADGHGDSLGGLRLAVSAGEPLPGHVEDALAHAVGGEVLNGLGSTEVGQTFVSNAPGARRVRSVGRALPPYEVRTVEERELEDETVGLLQVRGPTTTREYMNDPDATNELYDGTWLRTSDLARIDSDGFVHLRGRADDIEIIGGINVHPGQIEQTLSRHDDVLEAAVCSVRDETGASHLRAFVVRARQARSDAELERKLRECVATDHAAFKRPRSFAFVASLPRTPSGKLERFKLRAGVDRGRAAP